MKKLILALVLTGAAYFCGNSQNIKIFTPQGTDITNTSLTQIGTKDSLELITYLYVKNVSDATATIFSRKIQVAMMDSTEVYMCWAGGCYNSATFVSPSGAQIPGGQTVTDFSGHYSMTTGQGFKSGESIVTWVFFNGDSPTDSSFVRVKYSTWPLGMDENPGQPALSAIWPNPADHSASFTCTVPSGMNGAVIVRNLVGATIRSEAVAAGTSKLTLNTSTLADGIYFCSLLVNGKATQTKKLVVRH